MCLVDPRYLGGQRCGIHGMTPVTFILDLRDFTIVGPAKAFSVLNFGRIEFGSPVEFD
jgi:hypothetical protein